MHVCSAYLQVLVCNANRCLDFHTVLAFSFTTFSAFLTEHIISVPHPEQEEEEEEEHGCVLTSYK